MSVGILVRKEGKNLRGWIYCTHEDTWLKSEIREHVRALGEKTGRVFLDVPLQDVEEYFDVPVEPKRGRIVRRGMSGYISLVSKNFPDGWYILRPGGCPAEKIKKTTITLYHGSDGELDLYKEWDLV